MRAYLCSSLMEGGGGRSLADLRAKRERLEQLRRAQASSGGASGGGDARAPARGAMMRPPDAEKLVLPAELESLFEEALRRGVAKPGNVDTMRRNVESGRFTADHYIGMWRGRLGMPPPPAAAAAAAPSRQSQRRADEAPPSARRGRRTPPSVASLRRQLDEEEQEERRAQAELARTQAQIERASARRSAGRLRDPPPPLPQDPPAPPAPPTGAFNRTAAQPSGPVGAPGAEPDLLAAIRGGAQQVAQRGGAGLAELEDRLQAQGGRQQGSDGVTAQLSDALSGLRRQLDQGAQSGSDSGEEDGWLSEDDAETSAAAPGQPSGFHWARPTARALAAAPTASARAPAAAAPAPAVDPASPPLVRRSRTAQEPEWLPHEQPAAEDVHDEPGPPSHVQQAQAKVLSDPELHAILARRRATTDANAVIVATPESVTRVGKPLQQSDSGVERRGSRRPAPALPQHRLEPEPEQRHTHRSPRPSGPAGGGRQAWGADRGSDSSSLARAHTAPASSDATALEEAVVAMGFGADAVRCAQAERQRTHGVGFSHPDELVSALLREQPDEPEPRGARLEAQRQELRQVNDKIEERQATFEFLKTSVSGHELRAMAAEMESLLAHRAQLEADIGQVSDVPGGNAQTVVVQIPPGMRSGQQVQVALPDGRPFLFYIPPGVRPGQSVQLSVPAPEQMVSVAALPADRRSRPLRPQPDARVKRRPRGRGSGPRQSVSRLKYGSRLSEREATLRTLQAMGEDTREVEREIRAMKAIIEGDEEGDDAELAAAKAISMEQSQADAAVLTKEQRMLEEAIEASHQSAVEDEVRRKAALQEQIQQLEALLQSEKAAEAQRSDWPPITAQLRAEYNAHFIQLCGHGGSGVQSRITAADCWDFLQLASVPPEALQAIFELAVADHSAGVDGEEFVLAMHLTKGVRKGLELPAQLPAHLIPGGGGGESSARILELEAALAAARSQAADGGGGAGGDDALRSQLEETEKALAAVRYEKQLLENEAASGAVGAVLMGGGGAAGMSEQEVAALRAKVALLQKQLGELQQDEDESDWDGTLESAQKALRAAAERLMEGDESMQPEFDKWDARISTHPDHLAAEARKLAEWEAKERPKFAEALKFLRQLVPPDILRTTRVALEHAGMP